MVDRDWNRLTSGLQLVYILMLLSYVVNKTLFMGGGGGGWLSSMASHSSLYY